MAKHNVYFQLPTREIGNVDAHFFIYRNDEKLGQITISKGGMDYYLAKRKYSVSKNGSNLMSCL